MDYPSFSASIAVRRAKEAIAFYHAAFGAVERLRLTDPESGVVGHAELRIKDGLLMLAEEYPVFNKSPETLGGTAVRLCLMADDVDAEFARAIAAGATVVRAPSDQFYGHRSACLRDPFGHEWTLSREIEAVAPDEMQRRWNAMASAKPSEDQS
jgi:PhnB protein